MKKLTIRAIRKNNEHATIIDTPYCDKKQAIAWAKDYIRTTLKRRIYGYKFEVNDYLKIQTMEKQIKLVNYLNDNTVKPTDHIEKIMKISGIVFISVEEGWGILN